MIRLMRLMFLPGTLQLLLICLLCGPLLSQPVSFNFHQLSTGAGLSDPGVRCFAQDKYGYIWIGTLNGLNRFSGYEVKVFKHKANDRWGLAANYTPALVTDDKERLWIAQPNGICQYDYTGSRFLFAPAGRNFSIYKMIRGKTSVLFLATSKGLVSFNTGSMAYSFVEDECDEGSKLLMSRSVNDICLGGGGNMYIATDTGLVVYNAGTHKARLIFIKAFAGRGVSRLAFDTTGNLWAVSGINGELLFRCDSTFSSVDIYHPGNISTGSYRDNRIVSLLFDDAGRLWAATARTGLCLFDKYSNSFIPYRHDPFQPGSISGDLTSCLFQDKKGYIWLGTETSGVNYFNPAASFFTAIQPSCYQHPTLPHYWGRAAGEDKNGNLWLGTASGIARCDPAGKTFKLFQDTSGEGRSIQYNSVRSVLCDDDNIWIGTAQGLNLYHLSTGKMDRFGIKDAVPLSFFWNIAKDAAGNTWFGSRDGFYCYNAKQHKFENLHRNTHLSAYCDNNTYCIYKDSKGLLWFGFGYKGLMQFDPASGRTKCWAKKEGDSRSLSDDHVTSIAEDSTGIIWVGTMGGLNAYNPSTGLFIQYLNGSGSASEKTSALLVDKHNRIWFAADKGIMMLDEGRKYFKSFDISDGLPTLDFNNQSAFRMRNGYFIYPSLMGFVIFNPDSRIEQDTVRDFYISSFKISGNAGPEDLNPEEIKELHLSPDENFFSLEVTALNYETPAKNWYAYKLDPFDKEWIYTKDRKASYTNVPGGDYTFHYKTSVDGNSWNIPEKLMGIHVATVYYKSWWFRTLILVLVCFGIYRFYAWRIHQKEKLLSLQGKAYSLEREKAKVMYESLKQQLNPHFLFNSLTSLSSLITSSPADAKKFLERLSKIYRYILKSRDSEKVILSEEINLAGTYTQLQKTRFKDGLQLEVKVNEECLDRSIAPVTLQNLIENAIKHNIIDISSPLVVEIIAEGDWLMVRNNLQRKGIVETSNKQGLESMRSLYYFLSGRQIEVVDDGQYFTVKIPLL
ncbi:two-component regulator propeller domain-containing protein [Flavitalea sp. BT771]|uniref:ligand-binding sensor domain-containing protein n=1 Tax=Flavitalea sp. BT771 TaxID=3063329 RepID=UPI0026E30BE0|nr:two-component regulator propeller domain-containing protein [Flavitalea sp. BT771]MDO6435210.1 two-component regulator propeller domain-containing protein [Flavitalea sp. BT771]MDV6224085.1 two-component regulator propeller domain-containing protein [Flavitalea sp. BT771]